MIPKIRFFIEVDARGQGGTTHSFVYFKTSDGNVRWIENAWSAQKGTHVYKNEKSMIRDVISKWEKDPKYPYVYDGALDGGKLKTGMELQEIIDLVDFD